VKALSIDESLKLLKEALETQDRVFFSRFGDNDIMIAAKKQQDRKNFYGNNWTKWTPELAKELTEALQIKDPNFFVAASIGWDLEPGMKRGSFAPFENTEQLKTMLRSVIGDQQRAFLNPILFHYLGVFRGDALKGFIEKYIRPHRKMFIGCNPQASMEKMFGPIDYMIETPSKNAYSEINKWYPEIIEALKSATPPRVVILAAGQASRAVAARLWKEGFKVHCIDFGSIVDAMTTDMTRDKATRTWIANHGYKIRDLFSDEPTIEVIVPYRHDGNLGAHYNDCMEKAKDWVLFIDHDILILRPQWHSMCIDAIKEKGHRAGWISAVTNRIYCPDQRRRPPNDIDDIKTLIEFSNGLYSIAGNRLVKPKIGIPFSGFFILTHKKAWQDAGGFKNGFLGVDNDYYNKLIAAGYETWIMPGLFCYHIYDRKKLFSIDTKGVVGYEKEKREEKISVCMIVKNEEAMLPRCLDSVKPIADEIVIIDTGSTDRTVEIAKSYGAYVHHHPWQGNFSKHRNQSIEYSTGDWLLFIDADEELCGNVDELRNWLAAVPDEINAITVTMKDMHSGKVKMQFNPTKIFRKGSVHYEGIVHNQAKYEGVPCYCDVVHYKHYGYDLDEAKMKEKEVRRIGLLKKRIEANPEDYEALFYLSQAYGAAGDWQKMVEYGERYGALKDEMDKKSLPFDQSIYFSMIRAYQAQLGRPSDAKRWIDMATSAMEGINNIDIAFAICEHGVLTGNAEMIANGAQAYIKEYMQFEQKTQTMGAQFVHSYMPEALSYCIFHLGSLQFKNAMGTLNQLASPLLKLNKEESGRIMAEVRNVFKSCGLDFMAVKQVPVNMKSKKKKGKKMKKQKNFA